MKTESLRSLRMKTALILLASVALVATGASTDPHASDRALAALLELPAGMPLPVIPADNQPTAAKILLGRHLFYDARLSGNGTQSCASCHRQELAFTDGRATALGATGQHHTRGSMSIANALYLPALGWADPRVTTLEEQALVPMLNEQPVEMGARGREGEILGRLSADPVYRRLFSAAFPGDDDPFTMRNVARAIASFERTIVSGRSPFDRFVFGGDEAAMDESARRGMKLFFSDRTGCAHCHGGVNFSGPIRLPARVDALTGLPGVEAVDPRPVFHNTGLYDLDGGGAYPDRETGLQRVTGDCEDMGRFRAPSLRNVELTGPYMHDGSVGTLDEVLDHYAAGGRAGAGNPRVSADLRPFVLTAKEKTDLIAFLRALTDRELIGSSRFTNPWPEPRTAPGVEETVAASHR
jgi:cytochrome c peroxidase